MSRKPARRDLITVAAAAVEASRAEQISGRRRGQPSVYTCPDCGGTLWQVDTDDPLLFRCHVGHTLTGELLLTLQADTAEDALWRAIRTITDLSVLCAQLAAAARALGRPEAAAGFEARGQAARRQADALRAVAEETDEPGQ